MQLHQSHSTYQSGFTLIEMMIALAILAILLAFAVPQFQSHRESTRLGMSIEFFNNSLPKAAAGCLLSKPALSDCTATVLQEKGLQDETPWGDSYTVTTSGTNSLQFTFPLTSSSDPDVTGADLAVKLNQQSDTTASYTASSNTLTVTKQVN